MNFGLVNCVIMEACNVWISLSPPPPPPTPSLPLSLSSLCCVYLAFKVDEYNVHIEQFVHVLAPQLRSAVAEFVLGHEVVNSLLITGPLSLPGVVIIGVPLFHL